jgi:hypothetical protein
MRKVLQAVAIATLLLALGGCVVEGVGAAPAGIAVAGPPPAPMDEDRPAAPSPKASWVPGYWHWTGMQYSWIPGHWAEAPEGARWRPPRYSQRDGTYFYEPGGWSTPQR